MSVVFLMCWLCGVAWGQSAQELADQAVQGHPSLDGLVAKERALRASAEVAGAWTDPMFSVEYSNVATSSLALSGHPMSGLQFKVQQTLRPPKWSRLQRESGELSAEAVASERQEAALALAASVKQTWWLLAQSRLLKQVTEEHLARTEELMAAAESRYTTGTVGQHAVLRLSVLRDQLSDELGDFERSETELLAALGLALSSRELPVVNTVSEVSSLPPPEEGDWVAKAQDRPLLTQLNLQKLAAERSAQFQKVQAKPDINVWMGYRVRTFQSDSDPGRDLVTVGASMPFPLGSARRALGGQKSAMLSASMHSSASVAATDQIVAQMSTILARWSRAHQKATTYSESLIPKGRSTLSATQADFAVGRAEFASLFEAEVALLNLERARIIAAVQTHLLSISAEATLGVPAVLGAQ